MVDHQIVKADIFRPSYFLRTIAPNTVLLKSTGVTDTSLSFLLAKGAYVPESGYDSLDFSMPSYRVEADIAEPIKINDLLGGSTSATDNTGAKKASSPSSPNRAEKGAQAVAQAKAKKEAAKAEALAKQQALKEKATVQASN